MTLMTNVGRVNVHFTTGNKSGEPVTDTIRPGETKNVDIDRNSSQVKARVNAGQIRLGRVSATKAAPPPRNRVENPEPEPQGS